MSIELAIHFLTLHHCFVDRRRGRPGAMSALRFIFNGSEECVSEADKESISKFKPGFKRFRTTLKGLESNRGGSVLRFASQSLPVACIERPNMHGERFKQFSEEVHVLTELFQKIPLVLLLSLFAFPAFCQVSASATGPLELSVFGAGTGTWTGLSGGRNLGITAGADLSFRRYYGFRPALEVRGTYPIHGGHFDSEEELLVGLRVERAYGKFHPYGDFLLGRGAINYQNGGYPYRTTLYLRSNSTVFSPGAGIDYRLTHQFAVKGDLQYQHWDTPVTPSGTLNSKFLSAGLVYYFNFGNR